MGASVFRRRPLDTNASPLAPAQRFDHPARQIAFEGLVQAVDEALASYRLARQMQELLPSWSLANVVTAIQALRGVALIAAITLAAEMGDFHRFANPRQLMAYLGLTPSEDRPVPRYCVEQSPRPENVRPTDPGGKRLDLSIAGAGGRRNPQTQ